MSEEKILVREQEGAGGIAKKNQSLFMVSVIALVAGMLVLAIVFLPIAVVTGAVLCGHGDKRGWIGIVGGIIGLLFWYMGVSWLGW